MDTCAGYDRLRITTQMGIELVVASRLDVELDPPVVIDLVLS